jgi:hypothetical protein
MANKYGQMGRNPSKGRDTNAKRNRAKKDIVQADRDLKFSKLLVPVMSEKETPTSKEYLKKVEKALAQKEDANKRLISTYKKGGAMMKARGGTFKGTF